MLLACKRHCNTYGGEPLIIIIGPRQSLRFMPFVKPLPQRAALADAVLCSQLHAISQPHRDDPAIVTLVCHVCPMLIWLPNLSLTTNVVE